MKRIDAPAHLIKRPNSAHKGDAGRVLIVAGSRKYSGAAVLCVAGAGRSGAGYAIGAVPMGIADLVASANPGAIIHGLRQTAAGLVAFPACKELKRLVSEVDSVVIGPGWGKSEGQGALLDRLVSGATIPFVIDADALNLIAAQDANPKIPQNSILTPHPGEAGRLLGVSAKDVEGNRKAALTQLCELFACTVVLKGASTLVGFEDQMYENTTGNSAMAVAGMGDVLAGSIGALVAQGSSSFDAACQSVWAHGRAGDMATKELGTRGLQPADLCQFLPLALSELEQ